MAVARFRFTLTNLSDNSTEVLTGDPYGWEASTLKLSRDPVYSGVFNDYALDLEWHCNGGGKDFIDNVYNTEDINGEIEVFIEIRCDGTDAYSELYTGRLNLATYRTDTEVTTCSIERSTLYTKLKSREEINVDLETTQSIGEEAITAIATETIAMPSMEIKYEYEMQVPASVDQPFTYSTLAPISGGFNGIAFITLLGGLIKNDFDGGQPWIEYESLGVEPTDSQAIQNDLFISPILEFNGLLNGVAVDFPITINYEYDFHVQITDSTTTVGELRDVQGLKLVVFYGSHQHGTAYPMNVITLFSATAYSADPQITNVNVSGTGSFTLTPGNVVYLAWLYDYEAPTGEAPTIKLDFLATVPMVFKMWSYTKYRESSCKVAGIHEAFNQVVDAINDSDGNFYSDFYGRIDSDKVVYPEDGCGSMKHITNGLNIREFPDRPIYCNLKDLFDSCNAIDNIALFFENDIVRVEPLAYVYDKNTMIADLTSPVEVERKTEVNLYINKINIGYQQWDTDFKGGLDEPNTRHEYSTSINAAKGQLSRLSPYAASAYGIELTRRKSYRLFPTEDFRYDETNFFIQLYRTAYGKIVELQNEAFTTTSNMTARGSAYNLRLTPLRMLMANINRITAGLQIVNKLIKFVKGEGNFLFSDALIDNGCQEEANGVEYAENDSIAWNDANIANIEPLWLPETYTFRYPITFSQLQAIRANPHGYIQFLDSKNNVLKGYILDLEYEMKTGVTQFNLLRVFE